MRLIVLGAGAVGSLLGARLIGAGHDVILVARGAHLAAMQKEGLSIVGSYETHLRVQATATIPNGSSPDALLLTVKTYDLGRAATALARNVAVPVPVLALQNGLGILHGVERALRDGGWSNASAWAERGINTIPATLAAPGTVRQAGDGEILLRKDPSGHGPMFQVLFATAGIASRLVDGFDREVWRKALVNAAINPVTADHRIVNGDLARDPWRQQALALLQEAQRVAAAEGFAFSSEEVERDLFRVVRSTARNRSSMLQDIDRGRRTEIDAISGEILRLGRRHGLRLPATERMVQRFEGPLHASVEPNLP